MNTKKKNLKLKINLTMKPKLIRLSILIPTMVTHQMSLKVKITSHQSTRQRIRPVIHKITKSQLMIGLKGLTNILRKKRLMCKSRSFAEKLFFVIHVAPLSMQILGVLIRGPHLISMLEM